ncbi:MAG TPA: protease inhibitor I42 family protein [Pseudonocardiaceae bacterium]|nr:protease inhibitor I42 family protein [Pseudonocardiaceae bacterium]
MTSSDAATPFLVLSESDADRKWKIQVDGLTTVVLEENAASTGYVWRYEPAVGTQGLFQLLTDNFLPGGPVPGVPGAHVFLLNATRAGTTSLRFGLYPPVKPRPEREITFDIDIV